MEFSVETFGLTKRFGSITAVDMLDLRVGSNAIHGFLGPNGAGKTTTIKILVGLLRADSGRVRILGKDVRGDDPRVRQSVGYMPELPKFPRHLTAQELLVTYGRMYGLSQSQLRKDVPRLLETVGLTGRGKSRISGYSKGMQQRLGVAQSRARTSDSAKLFSMCLWRACVHFVVEVQNGSLDVSHVARAVAIGVNCPVCTVDSDPFGSEWVFWNCRFGVEVNDQILNVSHVNDAV